MKRRLFLKGLLSASAVAPVVAKAVTEPEFKHVEVSNSIVVKKDDQTIESITDSLWNDMVDHYGNRYKK